MEPWSYAEDRHVIVLHNSISGVYFEIWKKHDVGTVFSSGSSKEVWEVDYNFSTKAKKMFSPGLLSELQAAKGKDAIFNRIEIWTTVNVGPLVALKSDSSPNNRIILTLEGVVYLCPKGALIVSKSGYKLTGLPEADQFINESKRIFASYLDSKAITPQMTHTSAPPMVADSSSRVKFLNQACSAACMIFTFFNTGSSGSSRPSGLSGSFQAADA